jgi:hypothetical protein
MKFIFLSLLFFVIASATLAQQKIKVDYISKVPAAFKNCVALYTYDSIALQKQKYILLADFQNQGLISVNGRITKLQLTGSNTSGKINTSTYNGDGYTIILNYHTVTQANKYDLEAGSISISKNNHLVTFNIHGKSACDGYPGH